MSKVYLIGAGPGDPGLLTLRAKEILETADALVYDHLANKAFLNYAKPDAEIIYVGKKGGDHTVPQDQINRMLVDLVGRGKSVARLKGGDPYIFGRGAEEAEELLDAGASFEVVPGVTAAAAGTAYAGIPLTHRSYASSVSFITGHEDPTKSKSAHDWASLARGTSTLVFYMGVKNLPNIAGNLMKHGRSADTPAALVRWGTTCRHRSLVSTLGDIAREAKEQGFAAPSLIIVGDVVGLRDKLGWFEKRPLLGKGVVVTRAREQAGGLTRLLTDLGACVYEFPTIEISPLADYAEADAAVDSLSGYDWVIFTSVNGVKHFFERLAAKGLDARAFAGCRVAAIGPATAEALLGKGIRSDFTPNKYVAEAVVEGLLALGAAGKKILIPRARVAREILPEKLAEAGAEVSVLPVYETNLAGQDPMEVLNAVMEGDIAYVTFASSSTVENFFAKIKPEEFAPYADKVRLACIGPITAKTLEGFGFTPDLIPEEFTIPALAAAITADAR